jgi:hypothetical protein
MRPRVNDMNNKHGHHYGEIFSMIKIYIHNQMHKKAGAPQKPGKIDALHRFDYRFYIF